MFRMAASIDDCQYVWQNGGMTPAEPQGAPPSWTDCCTPTASGGLDQEAAETLAVVLKALAEPTRLRLVSIIAAHAGGEACICDLTEPVGLTQPTVSHHMKVLVDAGLLTREQRGKWAYYRLTPGAMESLAQALSLAVPVSA